MRIAIDSLPKMDYRRSDWNNLGATSRNPRTSEVSSFDPQVAGQHNIMSETLFGIGIAASRSSV